MKLSVIIPAYNEKNTILEVIRQVQNVELPKTEKELVIVDDGSTDGTREILSNIKDKSVKVLFNEKNLGKGGSIKNGIRVCTGNFIIFQDADLEYNPQEYTRLLSSIVKDRVDFVLGSRNLPKFFSGEKQIRMHTVGNRVICMVGNLLYGTRLTDYEPCYKLFKSSVLKNVKVVSNGFEYDIELMARLFKKKHRFSVVPITYKPRSVEEGKKIKWRDGLKAVWMLIKIKVWE